MTKFSNLLSAVNFSKPRLHEYICHAMMNLSRGQYLGNNNRCYDADGVILTETEYHEKVFDGWHTHENIHISLIIKGGNREERKETNAAILPGGFYQKRFHIRNG